MFALRQPFPQPPRSAVHLAVAACVSFGLLVVPLASPAFAQGSPRPISTLLGDGNGAPGIPTGTSVGGGNGTSGAATGTSVGGGNGTSGAATGTSVGGGNATSGAATGTSVGGGNGTPGTPTGTSIGGGNGTPGTGTGTGTGTSVGGGNGTPGTPTVTSIGGGNGTPGTGIGTGTGTSVGGGNGTPGTGTGTGTSVGGGNGGRPSGTLPGGVAGGLSGPFGSFAAVPGRPADKPIGVPFEALSRAGGALIRVDNNDVPRTSDGNNFAIAVINRHTREVVEYGTVNRAGTSQLGALAAKYSGRGDYLMVVSSFKGIVADAGNTSAFKTAVKQLGGRDLTDDEVTLLRNGAAFSVVGVPGGDGGAYISIDHGTQPDGNVFGYLQVNVANNLYGVVTAEYPTFNTTNTSTTPGVASVVFDHQTYRTETFAQGESGFLLLAFDNALRLDGKQTVKTNGTGNDRGAQFAFKTVLASFVADAQKRYGSTVVIRSVGHPTPMDDSWSDAAKDIERLGGNRLAFNNLGAVGGESMYSLVGSLVTPKAAVEGSTVLQDNTDLDGRGDVAGSLSRNREMVFTPVSGGAPTGVNTQLVDITYQTPQAFPAYTDGAAGTTAAGTAAADAYLGRALRLCAAADVQPVCSVRTEFYANYGASFAQASTDLASEPLNTYPGDGRGFTAADYTAVRRHLTEELSMVNRIRTYFAGLQKPFGEAAQSGTIDTKAITDALVAAIGSGGGSATTSYVLGLIGKIVAVGGLAGPPVSAVAAGLSASFGLSAYLTTPTGPPQLASDVKVRADQLGAQATAQLLATSRSINGLSMLIISDFGKMKAVDDKLANPQWRLPPDTGPAVATLSLAVKQSAAETLVPTVYPWLIRGTPERSAQSMSCQFDSARDVQVNVWGGQPLSASVNAPHDYFIGQRAVPAPYWFANSRITDDNITPSAGLANLLFAPANAGRGTLGINIYAFLTPRIFGTIHQANDAAYKCDLFRR